MKKLIFLTLLIPVVALAAPRTVMVDSSTGAVVYPANFANVNGLAGTNAILGMSRNVVFVSASRGSTNGVREDPGDPLVTIQGGTDAAHEGDTVYVLDGTFQETITTKTNVVYYFNSGVVLTNVAASPIFDNTAGPLTIRGQATIQAGDSGQAVFYVYHDVDVECASITVGTNSYCFAGWQDCTLKCKADSYSGGIFLSPDLGAVTDSLFEIKSFDGSFEDGACVVKFKDSEVNIPVNNAFSGAFTFDGGSATGALEGSNFMRGTVTDAATVSGATVTGTYYIP